MAERKELIQNEYIVLALRANGTTKIFHRVVNCEYWDIHTFVESLTFGTELSLHFISVQKLNEIQVLAEGDATKILYMNKDKALNKFMGEVEEALDELKIFKSQEEE